MYKLYTRFNSKIMSRTFTSHSQLVAFYDYSPEAKNLLVTLKDGNQYMVYGFADSAYKELKKASNKGSHIYHRVFKNESYRIEKKHRMSPKYVEQIIQAHFNKQNQVNRFKGTEGWGNYLAR